jgi:hypothetical protein
MGELVVFLLLMAVMAVFDVRAIKKSNLKNVLGMYIFLTICATGAAVWYLSRPDRMSILGYVMRFMNIKS